MIDQNGRFIIGTYNQNNCDWQPKKKGIAVPAASRETGLITRPFAGVTNIWQIELMVIIILGNIWQIELMMIIILTNIWQIEFEFH